MTSSNRLDPQSKLALMMTSAGSQRRLADLMGVSHQKIGRWLREGEKAVVDPYTGEIVHSAGAKKIPESAHALIDAAFEHHKEACKLQAHADDLPYIKDAPVFMFRKALRDGQPGQRGFVLDTQYIKQNVRTQIFASMMRSGIANANVRSTVDFVKYTGRYVEQERARGIVLGSKKQQIAESIASFDRKNTIVREDYKQTLFTPSFNTLPGADIPSVIGAIENVLQSKHSPAATSFADEYIFHILPKNYAIPKSKREKRAAKRK